MRTWSRNSDTADVELSADLVARCSPDDLFGWVDDLVRYEAWMALVHRATPIEPLADQPRWDVELRARIGPFARSKRLIMVRTACEPNHRVVFERREVDGRRHSHWRLSVQLAPIGDGTSLAMQLHYGGSLWTGGVVERVLHDEIDRSRDRLLSLVTEPTPSTDRLDGAAG